MWYEAQSNKPQRIAILVGALLIVWLLIGTRAGGSVFSTWRGDSAAAAAPAGLVGQAAQVGQVGRGATLIVPPGVSPDEPWGSPVVSDRVVMTQGYGVGSHAPAPVWGAIDLAVDGTGDGVADPQGSFGVPIRATMNGYVQVTLDSWPAGNHIWVTGERYKTGYSHLQSVEVENGQWVERGTIIATLGSTGEASGPHLDYQIWLDGVNQDPLNYHPMP